jgi:hypothetical protein
MILNLLNDGEYTYDCLITLFIKKKLISTKGKAALETALSPTFQTLEVSRKPHW